MLVEDLYRPYRPKRRTRATIAIERGLDPLALFIMDENRTGTLSDKAAEFIDPEKEVADAKAAIAGACDIIAENLSDDADNRTRIRELTMERGRIITSAKDPKADSVYDMYYEFDEAISKLPGHRILAINRGEKEKFLSVKVEAPTDEILRFLLLNTFAAAGVSTDNIDDESSYDEIAAVLKETVRDSYERLIAPSIEREIRNALTEKAEDGAIQVFGKNLEQLLMQPPIVGHVVLGWDPAFRTGCKLAVVDATGKVLDTTVIFPTEPQNKVEESKLVLKRLIDKYKIDLISVGNGTASRESEQIIAELIKEMPVPVQYVIVNEAGASVYSASKLATEEFPEFDVGQRSAASIARRLQDPLAELVKIDPKSIGVGQYQHDCDQKKLADALLGVVEDSVNRVGVDLNTASAALLSYVAGISKPVAKNIVAYRENNGSFKSRKELLSVAKLGPKAYEQCAGFLRIRGGDEPLDATGVHPESYAAADEILKEFGHSADELVSGGLKGITKDVDKLSGGVNALAERLKIGVPTLTDILAELEKPGRDPREDMPKPVLRSDVLDMKDLKPGMVLKGTVRNIVDFGAFVDIGVHQDGLVHISHMSEKFIKHPLEVVSVGDIVDVEVLEADVEKQRVALSMRIGKGDTAGVTGKPLVHDKPRRSEKGDKSRDKARKKNSTPHGNRDMRTDRGNNKGSFGSSMASLFDGIKLE